MATFKMRVTITGVVEVDTNWYEGGVKSVAEAIEIERDQLISDPFAALECIEGHTTISVELVEETPSEKPLDNKAAP